MSYPKIGILGGMGYQSTLMYYEGIHKGLESDYDKLGYPEIVIISVDLKNVVDKIVKGEWNDIVELLSSRISLLEKHEVDFALIATNTPHYVFPQVKERTKVELISIIESTLEHMKSKNFKKTLLLGTKFTMTNGTFEKVFGEEIEIITPSESDQDYLHEKIYSELEIGKITEETKNGFVNVIEKAKKDHAVDSVILGCTEIPLLLTEMSYCGVECVDTTRVHIKSVLEKCKSLVK